MQQSNVQYCVSQIDLLSRAICYGAQYLIFHMPSMAFLLSSFYTWSCNQDWYHFLFVISLLKTICHLCLSFHQHFTLSYQPITPQEGGAEEKASWMWGAETQKQGKPLCACGGRDIVLLSSLRQQYFDSRSSVCYYIIQYYSMAYIHYRMA